MIEWLRKKLRIIDIEDLQAGGNCGCCGTWVSTCVVRKVCPWTVCKECEHGRRT